jgi:L-alanine-DL-glutamate epimerase-like enolase superfamily enzyme
MSDTTGTTQPSSPFRRDVTSPIKRVEVRLVRMPLAVATAFATRSVTARDYVLVKVISAEGVEGLGWTYAGSRAGEVTLEAVETLFGPMLISRNPLMVEGLWEQMYRESLLHGRSGAAMRALSALDIAIWDLNARTVGLPLWQYLGAHSDGKLQCYASGGYYRAGKSVDDLADEMGAYCAAGFRAMKMKVGLRDLSEEVARIKAVRERIGPDVKLFLDANNAWPDLFTALPFIRQFEPFLPGWIEEPFSPDDIESHSRLVAATTIPVATGEIESGRWRFRELLQARAAHVLQADAVICGGVTEWRRIAALAAAYGVPVCPHAWHDIHAQLAASVPNSPFVEYFVDNSIINTQPMFDREIAVVKGEMILPTEPGLAFRFNEATLERYGTSPWHTVR